MDKHQLIFGHSFLLANRLQTLIDQHGAVSFAKRILNDNK